MSAQEENRTAIPAIGDGAIHEWFELTYAQYLTIPRSVLQTMSLSWQERFVELLNELDKTIDWMPKEGRYWVQLKDDKGRYAYDPFMDYGRGRVIVPIIKPEKPTK